MAGSPDDRYPEMDNGEPAPLRPSDVKRLTDEDLAYILDGDGHGAGGHAHGTRMPGKSEFPHGWGAVQVRRAVESGVWGIDPNQTLTASKDGVVLRTLHDGVVLAIPIHDYATYWEIASAYPLSGDGVRRIGPTGEPVAVPLNLDDLTRRLDS